MNDPLETPDAPLNWNPAAVELPQIPMLPPGEDAMSATISAVLPTLTAPLAASVASLSAKENMFRGKLGAAESQYQNADGSGQESLGQLTSMLGQVGQMGQQAGKAGEALSGQTGMFGSLMEQAMKGAQGGGGQSSGGQSSGGQSSGGQGGAAGAAGSPAAGGQPPQQARDDAAVAEHEQPEQRQESQRDEREPLQRAETDDRDKADGAEGNRPGAGQAPVAPPERDRGEDDLSRRM